MNTKKIVKILAIMMISIMLVTTISTCVFAATDFDPIKTVDPKKGNADTTKLTNLGNKVANILTTAGSIISVIVLIILGIKYMMGSAEEKAEYKKTLLPYIIGAALIFSASTIASVIFNFAKGV